MSVVVIVASTFGGGDEGVVLVLVLMILTVSQSWRWWWSRSRSARLLVAADTDGFCFVLFAAAEPKESEREVKRGGSFGS